jgi:anti-sigma regulatory factor (Ser/Thr protein kinase)
MRELSLHLLDIATNSIEAQATRVILCIEELAARNELRIRIKDNGRGMSPELIARVLDPFVTTRTTRPVGLGLSLLHQAARDCGGALDITSTLGKGTVVTVRFKFNSLNRMPLGDIGETLANLCIGAPDVHFVYIHTSGKGVFCFDSFWFYRLMAERECSMHQLALEAVQHIQAGLKQIAAQA